MTSTKRRVNVPRVSLYVLTYNKEISVVHKATCYVHIYIPRILMEAHPHSQMECTPLTFTIASVASGSAALTPSASTSTVAIPVTTAITITVGSGIPGAVAVITYCEIYSIVK